MTLSIPDELARRMKLLREVRWSEVARRAIEQRVTDLEVMDRIASKSKLNEKDILELSKKIKSAASKKF